MSFNADAHVSARGLTYEALQPFNPAHEAIAEEILTAAIPENLGEAYERLAHLAQQMRGADGPVDQCLHCWITGAASIFAPFPGKQSFRASDADRTDPLIMGMRRIAMFDVPRKLFAQQHGLWVYWLFGNVFVLSPRQEVDLDWAFDCHAFRLEWKLSGTMPRHSRTEEQARHFVRGNLRLRQPEGLARIREGLEKQHDLGIDNVEVHGPLFEPVTAWMGSLTGRELLREELGLSQPLVTYNCCGDSPDKEPSAVKQLQNQSPDKRDC